MLQTRSLHDEKDNQRIKVVNTTVQEVRGNSPRNSREKIKLIPSKKGKSTYACDAPEFSPRHDEKKKKTKMEK